MNEYYRQRARQPPKARMVSMTAEEREARRQQIEANRLKMEAELRERKPEVSSRPWMKSLLGGSKRQRPSLPERVEGCPLAHKALGLVCIH